VEVVLPLFAIATAAIARALLLLKNKVTSYSNVNTKKCVAIDHLQFITFLINFYDSECCINLS